MKHANLKPLGIRRNVLIIDDTRIILNHVARYVSPKEATYIAFYFAGKDRSGFVWQPPTGLSEAVCQSLTRAALCQLDNYFMGGSGVSNGNPTRKRNRGRSDK